MKIQIRLKYENYLPLTIGETEKIHLFEINAVGSLNNYDDFIGFLYEFYNENLIINNVMYNWNQNSLFPVESKLVWKCKKNEIIWIIISLTLSVIFHVCKDHLYQILPKSANK